MHHIKKQQDSDQFIHLIHIEDKDAISCQEIGPDSQTNILYDFYALLFQVCERSLPHGSFLSQIH